MHFGQAMPDMVSHQTRVTETAQDRIASVAERSVLSQNFIIGEEKSEKSLMGSSSGEDVSKAYEEFREEVNKLSRVSTAATHKEFIDEISQRKYISIEITLS